MSADSYFAMAKKQRILFAGSGLVFVLLIILFLIPRNPAIEFSEQELRFEPTRIGNESRLEFTVRNVGKGTLRIRSATTEARAFSVVRPNLPISIGSGSSANFVVVFRPFEGAPSEGTLVFVSNDKKSGSAELPLVGREAITTEKAFEIFDSIDERYREKSRADM